MSLDLACYRQIFRRTEITDEDEDDDEHDEPSVSDMLARRRADLAAQSDVSAVIQLYHNLLILFP